MWAWSAFLHVHTQHALYPLVHLPHSVRWSDFFTASHTKIWITFKRWPMAEGKEKAVWRKNKSLDYTKAPSKKQNKRSYWSFSRDRFDEENPSCLQRHSGSLSEDLNSHWWQTSCETVWRHSAAYTLFKRSCDGTLLYCLRDVFLLLWRLALYDRLLWPHNSTECHSSFSPIQA